MLQKLQIGYEKSYGLSMIVYEKNFAKVSQKVTQKASHATSGALTVQRTFVWGSSWNTDLWINTITITEKLVFGGLVCTLTAQKSADGSRFFMVAVIFGAVCEKPSMFMASKIRHKSNWFPCSIKFLEPYLGDRGPWEQDSTFGSVSFVSILLRARSKSSSEILRRKSTCFFIVWAKAVQIWTMRFVVHPRTVWLGHQSPTLLL